MTFVNQQVELESLPEFASVDFQELHPNYAPVVLGVALIFLIPAFLFVTALIFVILVPSAGMPLWFAGLVYVPVSSLLLFLSWFTFKSARVMRYAIRQHDIIVHSGIFWKKETVQPIRRVQHVEQHQGPVDKRFGLYELKLFSAGTGQFTFRIPGLDADSASRIRQFILAVQQDGWGDDTSSADAIATKSIEADSHDGMIAESASGPTMGPADATDVDDLDAEPEHGR
jgi:membrane protein YdbS with pleckstrin-like domain